MDSSILDSDKEVVFFSYNYFIEQIVKENACFICGVKKETKEFNNEHVIPNWIIKKYRLEDERIILPNKQKINYTKYKIPCCKQCNEKLAAFYEAPISRFFNKPFDEKINYLKNNPLFRDKLYKWIGLIFFKTHLYDTKMLFHLNRSIDSPFIGSFYNWNQLHILHSIVRNIDRKLMVRSVFSNPMIYRSVLYNDEKLNYDYHDHFDAMTSMLKIGDMTFLIPFLDFGIGHSSVLKNRFENLKQPLNIFQGVEIFSRVVAFLSTKKINRKFSVLTDNILHGELLNIEEKIGIEFNDLFLSHLDNRLEVLGDANLIREQIKKGNYSFFDNSP